MEGLDFKWSLFNLVTQKGPSHAGLYFSGRMYVVARMLKAMQQAVEDWRELSEAERTEALRNIGHDFKV